MTGITSTQRILYVGNVMGIPAGKHGVRGANIGMRAPVMRRRRIRHYRHLHRHRRQRCRKGEGEGEVVTVASS